MGAALAKCLSPRMRTVIADAIPDRELLVGWAERVAAFEEELAVKKQTKRDVAQLKKAAKVLTKLRSPRVAFSHH